MSLEEQNAAAQMHSLTKHDSLFFRHRMTEITDRLNEILNENQLTGKWAISEDYEWLVKVSEE